MQQENSDSICFVLLTKDENLDYRRQEMKGKRKEIIEMELSERQTEV